MDVDTALKGASPLTSQKPWPGNTDLTHRISLQSKSLPESSCGTSLKGASAQHVLTLLMPREEAWRQGQLEIFCRAKPTMLDQPLPRPVLMLTEMSDKTLQYESFFHLPRQPSSKLSQADSHPSELLSVKTFPSTYRRRKTTTSFAALCPSQDHREWDNRTSSYLSMHTHTEEERYTYTFVFFICALFYLINWLLSWFGSWQLAALLDNLNLSI